MKNRIRKSTINQIAELLHRPIPHVVSIKRSPLTSGARRLMCAYTADNTTHTSYTHANSARVHVRHRICGQPVQLANTNINIECVIECVCVVCIQFGQTESGVCMCIAPSLMCQTPSTHFSLPRARAIARASGITNPGKGAPSQPSTFHGCDINVPNACSTHFQAQ